MLTGMRHLFSPNLIPAILFRDSLKSPRDLKPANLLLTAEDHLKVDTRSADSLSPPKSLLRIPLYHISSRLAACLAAEPPPPPVVLSAPMSPTGGSGGGGWGKGGFAEDGVRIGRLVAPWRTCVEWHIQNISVVMTASFLPCIYVI